MAAVVKEVETAILLTTAELSERWLGKVQANTLENWRSMKKGPPYIKLGKGNHSPVLYRLADVVAYERAMTISPKRKRNGSA